MCNKAFKDYKEAKEYIKTKPYEIIVNLIHLVLTYEKEQEKQLSQKVANEAETNK